MNLNDIRSNRDELDKTRDALLAERRRRLLGRIRPGVLGLLVWHFGAGGEVRDPAEIPIRRIEEFVAKYAA
jgi:hypothetical protein